MKRRVLYLLRYYATTVLLFLGAKVVFMLCHHTHHPVSVAEMGQVLLHGGALDLSTALYIFSLPFLLTMVAVWVNVPRWIWRAYSAIVAVALALAFVADTSLYAFWGFKLNASCLQYLETPEGITQSVSAGYLVMRALSFTVLAALIYLLLHPNAEHGHQPNTLRSRIGETMFYVLLMPLIVIGLRGGVRESTTNIGQVYFSSNQFLNHSAINPVFSFLYSLSHQMGDTSAYQYFSEAECQALLQQVYTTESQDCDTLLTTRRPHIVIILLESAGEEFAMAMPHLQALKQQSIYYSQCYGNSWRTDRGTVCALSGYPSFPSISVMKMPEKSRTLPSIAYTLAEEGYTNHYYYGGDINFTNMRSYLIGTGWQQLTSMDDYTAAQQHTAEWGVRDDITFQSVLNHIRTLPTDTVSPRQLIGYSTLSSHEPWDVPTHIMDDKVLNAFAYLDQCLYDFVEQVKATPQWEHLLLIMLPDHGINYRDIDEQQPLLRNHIPMLWLGGAIKEPRQIATLCNQTDLAATLLGQLHLDHHDFTFSRDVLSATYTYPTAVHNYSNAQMLIDSTGHVVWDFDAQRLTISHSSAAEHLTQVSKAIAQQTLNDLNNR